jgi:hypothetical protein
MLLGQNLKGVDYFIAFLLTGFKKIDLEEGGGKGGGAISSPPHL